MSISQSGRLLLVQRLHASQAAVATGFGFAPTPSSVCRRTGGTISYH